jgi:hypothetical protein
MPDDEPFNREDPSCVGMTKESRRDDKTEGGGMTGGSARDDKGQRSG